MRQIQAQREINGVRLRRALIAPDTRGKEYTRGITGGGGAYGKADREAGRSYRCADGQNDRRAGRMIFAMQAPAALA